MLLQTDRLTVRPVEASDWKAIQKGQAIVFQGGIFEKGFEKKAEGVL